MTLLYNNKLSDLNKKKLQCLSNYISTPTIYNHK